MAAILIIVIAVLTAALVVGLWALCGAAVLWALGTLGIGPGASWGAAIAVGLLLAVAQSVLRGRKG